jgi:antibiotic biosynthesis monooxygenase (ABM) superfamily enzyme
VQIQGTRASSVIVHRLRPDRVGRFLEFQRGITEAARAFPGYQATDVYPPAEGRQAEWVVVIHFDGPEALQRWLDSPVRARWVERIRTEVGDFRLKTLPTGFGAWFAGQVDGSEGGQPPSWKIALAVLLALYPTVMVLSLVLPSPDRFGTALTMLVSNVLSVCILQWGVTPALNAVLAPWLRANGTDGRRVTLVGLVLILATLGAMAALFRRVTG